MTKVKTSIPVPAKNDKMKAVTNIGKEEMILSKALWHSGVRFRKNSKKIKGSPDISIKKYKLAIFVDGEFWHGHNWGERKTHFKTNIQFWQNKIERNMARDKEIDIFLVSDGWTVLHFWCKEITSDVGKCVKLINHSIDQIRLKGFVG